jgi:hypothetical protein
MKKEQRTTAPSIIDALPIIQAVEDGAIVPIYEGGHDSKCKSKALIEVLIAFQNPCQIYEKVDLKEQQSQSISKQNNALMRLQEILDHYTQNWGVDRTENEVASKEW